MILFGIYLGEVRGALIHVYVWEHTKSAVTQNRLMIVYVNWYRWSIYGPAHDFRLVTSRYIVHRRHFH